MDSQPVANSAAGTGLSAVLETDGDMQAYLAPSGSTAGWAANQYLNPREIPVALQFLDWNGWLPPVHPMGAYGSTFTDSTFNTFYWQLRSDLQPNSTTLRTRSDRLSYVYGFAKGLNWDFPLNPPEAMLQLFRQVKSDQAEKPTAIEPQGGSDVSQPACTIPEPLVHRPGTPDGLLRRHRLARP